MDVFFILINSAAFDCISSWSLRVWLWQLHESSIKNPRMAFPEWFIVGENWLSSYLYRCFYVNMQIRILFMCASPPPPSANAWSIFEWSLTNLNPTVTQLPVVIALTYIHVYYLTVTMRSYYSSTVHFIQPQHHDINWNARELQRMDQILWNLIAILNQ